jgi:manganese/iron transport system permease protein
MMLLGPVIGGASALVGMYVSWSLDLPVGGTIVLVATAFFLLAWCFAPRHGLIAKRLRTREQDPPPSRAVRPIPLDGVPEPATAARSHILEPQKEAAT